MRLSYTHEWYQSHCTEGPFIGNLGTFASTSSATSADPLIRGVSAQYNSRAQPPGARGGYSALGWGDLATRWWGEMKKFEFLE